MSHSDSTTKNISLTFGSAIFSQAVNMVVALLLPRLLILSYGSDFNGIVSAARQFSNYLAMIDSGMYAATCYQFIKAYKNNDHDLVNNLYTTVGAFFRKTSYFVFVITILLSVGYGFITKSNVAFFDVVYIFFMYSLGTIIAYFGFFKYNIVLFSNGKQYFITFICAIFSLLSLAGQWFTVKLGGSMYLMVAIYPAAILLRLFVLKQKTKSEHPYLKTVLPTKPELISQKWDSLVLNISDNMKTFAPILGISWMFGSSFVSVYTTYETVLHLGSSILITVLNGLVPTLGKDLTENSFEAKKKFRTLSLLIYYLSAIISICFSSMIVSFIYIYIGNKADMEYRYPFLAFFMVISVWFLMIRTSFDLLIKANGYIKELRKGAVVEIVLALSLCMLFSLMNRIELIPLGVVISTSYRTVRMCKYASRNMKFDNNNQMFKDMIFWSITTCAICLIGTIYMPLAISLMRFVVCSFCVLLCAVAICSVIFCIIDRTIFFECCNFINKRLFTRKRV